MKTMTENPARMMVLLAGIGVLISTVTLAEVPQQGPEEVPLPLPIKMSEAVRAAETVIPGQVIEAELGFAESREIYEINVIGADNAEHTVLVDARNGDVAVISDENRSDENPSAAVEVLQRR